MNQLSIAKRLVAVIFRVSWILGMFYWIFYQPEGQQALDVLFILIVISATLGVIHELNEHD